MMNIAAQPVGVDLEASPALQILGPLRFSVDNRHGTIGANRVRTLLAVLGLTPREVVSIDFLVEELFGEIPSKNPKNALQANIRRLRSFLEQTTGVPGNLLVRTSNNGYLLDLPSEAVDARRFEALAAKGAGLVRDRPLEAIAVLEEALRLWRGPALLDVAGGHRCRTQASLLNNQRVASLEDLYGARLAVGVDDRNTVQGLEQLAAEHPERERISELLMLALYRTGRQGEALAAFQRVRSWLKSELGLEPGKSMRRIQQAILAQDPAIDARPFSETLP
ncbi:BTAD domain-containing putative transcriptional regulator [Streptomyces sp. NPDC059176]|uniref:AfsR/SARP family transcriptional regulator n=1 Tax=unclassified Streptomyces TaxID=2593676 RepID=UPI0036BD0B69